MYKVENMTVTTILGAARKMIKIRTNHNSDPHEYRLGPHEKEITLKIDRKKENLLTCSYIMVLPTMDYNKIHFFQRPVMPHPDLIEVFSI